MAIKLATTRTEPVPGAIVKFTITSADAGDGQYELMQVPRGARGLSVKLSGAQGAAVTKLVYKNHTDDTFEDVEDGVISVGEQTNLNSGAFSHPYLDVASINGTTDIDVEASVFL